MRVSLKVSVCRALGCAVALFVVLCTELTPMAGGQTTVGAIAGHVKIVARSSRRLATAGVYPGRTVGIPVARDTSELDNVVVFVNADPRSTLVATNATMRQTNEEFIPHVLAVTAGSTVDFPNDDLIFHNVFSLSRSATFDLGRYPRGTSKSRTFSEPGIVKVFCHLHSHMSAVVRVFDHPHFTIPDRQGRFTISGVEAGRYEIVAWHERIGDVVHAAHVGAGETTEVSFSLPIANES